MEFNKNQLKYKFCGCLLGGAIVVINCPRCGEPLEEVEKQPHISEPQYQIELRELYISGISSTPTAITASVISNTDSTITMDGIVVKLPKIWQEDGTQLNL